MSTITIGVLGIKIKGTQLTTALQGAFLEHINHLNALKDLTAETLVPIEVRNQSDLQKCNALIIPGGESTTIALVAEREGLLTHLREFVKSLPLPSIVDSRKKNPTWGTCAGLILLSEKTSNPKKNGQELIGGLPICTTRNYFGSQIASFEIPLSLTPLSTPFPAIFIRAPIVEEIYNDEGLEVLGKLEVHDHKGQREVVVAVRKGNLLGTAFHPELTEDIRLHEWWVREVVIPALKSKNDIKEMYN